MTTELVPHHYLRLLEQARCANGYSAYEATQGRTWCDNMVEMGLMTRRGVYTLDFSLPHAGHAENVDKLYVYDTTVKGRAFIGKPFLHDRYMTPEPSRYVDDARF